MNTENNTNMPIYLIFDRAPGPDGAVFIEAETADGKSVNAGEWGVRDDGLVQFGPFYRAAPERLPVQYLPDEQAAFEDWYSDGKFSKSIERVDNGYKLMQTHQAWRVWQARAALTPPVSAPKFPDLYPVITWLEGGCDPLDAAKELRLYQKQVGHTLPPEAQQKVLAPIAVAPEGWINVGDRLPAKGVGVLVYSPPTEYDHPGYDNIRFDCIDPDGDGDNWLEHSEHYEHYCMVAVADMTGPSEKAPYTHWMPMPVAPQSPAVPIAAVQDDEARKWIDAIASAVKTKCITFDQGENIKFARAIMPTGAAVQAQGDERSMFEDYAKGKGFRLDRKDDGEYVYLETADRWKIWQATFYAASAYGFDKGQRAALQSPPVSKVANIQRYKLEHDCGDYKDETYFMASPEGEYVKLAEVLAALPQPAVEAPSELPLPEMVVFSRESDGFHGYTEYKGYTAKQLKDRDAIWSARLAAAISALGTERTMYKAWRKRAEEAEQRERIAALPAPLPKAEAASDERIKFENTYNLTNTTRKGWNGDRYSNDMVQFAWEGWRACAALAPSAAQLTDNSQSENNGCQ